VVWLQVPACRVHVPGVECFLCLKETVIVAVRRNRWLQNSLHEDFVQCASAFFNHLSARGHESTTIQRLFKLAAARLDQKLTMTPAPQPASTSDEQVFLHMEYHPRQIERQVVQKVYRDICSTPFQATVNTDNQRTGIGRLTIAHSRPTNFRDLLCSTKMVQPARDRVSDHIDRLRLAAHNT
jgi:hypothetical protein